jgi:lipoate-protein ligase A
MVFYIESDETDPRCNLALEQYVFDCLDRQHSYFMLWQNHNAIIIGKHQNTQGEINAALVQEQGITVVRRLSGGGAVYHDLGNLNYTFITGAGKGGIDFSLFCRPVQEALVSFGVPVEISGRNDMTVEGKKFSGSAQYIKEGRIMHHGTILYDSDLAMLGRALKVRDDKIASKGIKSVQSRVTNIRPYMKSPLTIAAFREALKRHLTAALDLRELRLAPSDWERVEELRERVYSQWSWNYGASPPYNIRKVRRIEGCGTIEVLLDVGGEGRIKGLFFYGDFFGTADPQELAPVLSGCPLEYGALKAALAGTDISRYFHALDTETFITLLEA